MLVINCSKDDSLNNGKDDLSVQNLEKILGIWTFKASTTNGVADVILDPCRLLFNINFESTYASIQEYSGDNCSTIQSTSEDYSINRNTLKVGDFTAEIITLNTSTLIIKYNEGSDAKTELYLK
ncbi:lipocalin family protein [Gilvirhabdus luticola]|nr:lipocalin family protein [Yeosuana sp. MJ-SS3]